MKNKILITLTLTSLSLFVCALHTNATGTCPVALSDIESQGILIYDTENNDATAIKLYTSDLVNLKNEIEALGIYSDEEFSDINLHIDEVIADVSSGKRNVASRMNNKGANINLSDSRVPTWDNLYSGVEDVYNEGYENGHDNGYDEGYTAGEHDGYLDGYEAGNEDGDTAGYTRGYNKGKSDGYEEGYEEGYNKGYSKGLNDGITVHTATYTATLRSSAIDLGKNHTYRYINTIGVPNSNSGTYTFSSGNGATVDLGTTNTYRYVNATNVYNKGKTDGAAQYSFTTQKRSFQGSDTESVFTVTFSFAHKVLGVTNIRRTDSANWASVCERFTINGNKVTVNSRAGSEQTIEITAIGY